jgi:hypothetical protein
MLYSGEQNKTANSEFYQTEDPKKNEILVQNIEKNDIASKTTLNWGRMCYWW